MKSTIEKLVNAAQALGATFEVLPDGGVRVMNSERLHPESLAILRVHKDLVVDLLTKPSTTAPDPKETPAPLPSFWLGGRKHQLREGDLVDAVRQLGDDELAKFRDGRMPRETAVWIAMTRMRDLILIQSRTWRSE